VTEPSVLATTSALKHWAIQIGAFASAPIAEAQLVAYAKQAIDIFAFSQRYVVPIAGNDGQTLYRARFGMFGEDEARTLFGKLDRLKTIEDMATGAAFLQKHAECTGRFGAVGFCWGGGMVNTLATRIPDLGAAVPFYGTPPPDADVAKIKAPMLIHYAGTDTGINGRWPAFEAALKAANVKYTMHMYDGASHGFNNDTTPRYDEKAATLAWSRTLEFFNANLRK